MVETKRKARPYVHRPKSNGDKGKYVDYVARALVKPAAVGTSVVQVQAGGSRQPRDVNSIPDVVPFYPEITLIPKGKKWCSHCNEWVKFEGFSPNKGNRDGLQSWCKMCRADHARYIYWQQKNTAAPEKRAA